MNRRERRRAELSRHLDRDATAVQSESLPRTIAVEEFAQARLREISVLKSALENKVGGSKRASQDLPRHLRRRASSHNVYRLPARLRARAKAEIEQQALRPANQPKRRERRRPSRMMQEHARRARAHVWLETHLWHAKRMRMENIWGHRMAVRPTDKGQRATYKAALHFATLYDASASCCVQIDGPADVIVSRLAPFLPAHRPALAMSPGDCRSCSVLFHREDHALGPIDLLWSPPSDSNVGRALWIWCHPSISALVLAVVTDCFEACGDVSVGETELVKFELLGSRCQSILSNSLRPAPSCGEFQAKVWKLLSAVRSQSSLPRGVVLALDVIDPRTFSTTQHIAPVYPDGSDNRIRVGEPGMEDLFSQWPLELAATTLYTQEGRHRATCEISNTENASVPVMLAQRQIGGKRSQGMSGWDLIVPKGWAMAFWKSLIFAGCRAIGLDDKRNIYLEQGAPFFPDDYPDTAACAMQSAFRAKSLGDKHARTPKAKRVNYEANAISSPFQPDWSMICDCAKPSVCPQEVSELVAVGKDDANPAIQVVRGVSQLPEVVMMSTPPQALVRIVVVMRWGGVPKNNALVYGTTDDDQKSIEANNWQGLATLDVGHDRPVLAIIHAGGFLFSAGSGIGYGFASVLALQNQSSGGEHGRVVLLRNTNSKHFLPAILRIAY